MSHYFHFTQNVASRQISKLTKPRPFWFFFPRQVLHKFLIIDQNNFRTGINNIETNLRQISSVKLFFALGHVLGRIHMNVPCSGKVQRRPASNSLKSFRHPWLKSRSKSHSFVVHSVNSSIQFELEYLRYETNAIKWRYFTTIKYKLKKMNNNGQKKLNYVRRKKEEIFQDILT